VSGPAGPASVGGSLAMGAPLALAAAACRCGFRMTRSGVVLGLGGVLVLVAPVLVTRGLPGWFDLTGYAGWSLAVGLVATAEEAFLRGALFDALTAWRGRSASVVGAAVVGAAVLFALLHVPLYGVHVLPVDFAVGLVLGGLRVATGTWTAPAIAHVGADLVGWWLV
jgi:membrane protease YdiL (CAAX protease family)